MPKASFSKLKERQKNLANSWKMRQHLTCDLNKYHLWSIFEMTLFWMKANKKAMMTGFWWFWNYIWTGKVCILNRDLFRVMPLQSHTIPPPFSRSSQMTCLTFTCHAVLQWMQTLIVDLSFQTRQVIKYTPECSSIKFSNLSDCSMPSPKPLSPPLTKYS